MLLIPAIDLKEGRCVRLRQGNMQDETVFSDDPVAVAQRWFDCGAKRLHIVDLDGAVSGTPANKKLIAAIAQKLPDLQIQVGGGIRSEATIQSYLNAGVQFVIIGSKAARDTHFISHVSIEFPSHIYVGIDARDGKVATDGWSKISQLDAVQFAKRMEKDGAETIIYTDILKDGMMQGVNIQATVQLAQSIHIPVIASGGVSSMRDIEALCEVSHEGIMGVIIGRALYEGTVNLADAIKWVEQNKSKH